MIFSLTGCGESKKPETTTAATEAVTQTPAETTAQNTTAAKVEDATETVEEKPSEENGHAAETGLYYSDTYYK